MKHATTIARLHCVWMRLYWDHYHAVPWTHTLRGVCDVYRASC